MKTNSFFDFNRFVLFAKQDLLLNKNKYLLIFSMFLLGLYTMIVFQMYENPYGYVYHHEAVVNAASEGWAYMNLFVMVLIGYAAFIGISFSGMGSKVKCANYLTIPASTFEKYLFPFLFRMVFGLVLFTLIFWVDTRLARLTLMNSPKFILHDYTIVPFQFTMLKGTVSDLFIDFERFFMLAFIGIYLFVVPLFFRKQALVKTVVSFFVLIFLFFSIMVGLSHVFNPNVRGFNVDLDNIKISDHIYILDLLSLFLTSVSSILLVFLGYFKLKEKQI